MLNLRTPALTPRVLSGRLAQAGMATAAAMALLATPSLAQKVPPAPAIDVFAEAFDSCTQVVDEDALTEAGAFLTGAGWLIDYTGNIGPSTRTLSASRTDTRGDAYFYAEATSYPTVFMAHCTYDAYSVRGVLDLATLAQGVGLEGQVEAFEGGNYGTWEMLIDEGAALFTAYQQGDYFSFQMYWVEWGAPGR